MDAIRRHLDKVIVAPNRKTRFAMAMQTILFLGLWFFAMVPFTKWTYLNEFYKLCWVFEIAAVIFHAFYTYTTTVGPEYSLGGLVSSMLFLAQVTAHLTVLWDVSCTRKKRQLLYEKLEILNNHLIESKLEVPFDVNNCFWKQSLLFMNVLLQMCILHSVISWTTFQVHTTATALYWHGFLSTLALQFRVLEFLISIRYLNTRLWNLRCNINAIGERNLKRIFHPTIKPEMDVKNGRFLLVSPYQDEEEDERELIVLKSLHNEFFAGFRMINDCYSWSLLAFTALYFIDFVTNSYWVVLGMITQRRDNLAFLQNGGFLWIIIVMLSLVCWYSQQSHSYSRQIGCLIFKLVKPMGNKRYNDLVNEFSLQTMHQQFVITAKEFFSLNLNLLGSMVAAIVTYLVILIQFMFTEKSNLERAMTTISPLNITSTMAAFTPSNISLNSSGN